MMIELARAAIVLALRIARLAVLLLAFFVVHVVAIIMIWLSRLVPTRPAHEASRHLRIDQAHPNATSR